MDLKRAAESYRPVAERFMRKYPGIPRDRLIAELKRLIEITSNSRDLINKSILDLGCGSKETADRAQLIQFFLWIIRSSQLNQFHPWYARIAHEAGAKVVGVDIASNSSEEFESRILDLTNPHALTCFDNESFDAVNNFCLTVPPESHRAQSGTSPAIIRRFGMDTEQAFELNREIFYQVQRLLRNGGTYTLSELVYKKRKGKLKIDHKIEGLGA
jgi:SAM-dependent methyltransferase